MGAQTSQVQAASAAPVQAPDLCVCSGTGMHHPPHRTAQTTTGTHERGGMGLGYSVEDKKGDISIFLKLLKISRKYFFFFYFLS